MAANKTKVTRRYKLKKPLLVSVLPIKGYFSTTKSFQMGAVHTKIKKLREQSELTQPEMAQKMNMHLKTWQKIENGITRLDIDRLRQIAEILGTTVEDLINVDDAVYIHEIKDNDVGYNGSSVTINHRTEDEKTLYERIIAEKEKIIADKDKEIAFYRDMLAKKSE